MEKKRRKSKGIVKDIVKLRKEGRYQEIFDKYGQILYKNVVPTKYKKAHIKRLFSEGRYEDIYRLYGRDEYEKLLYKIMREEVKEETGETKGKIELALMANQGRFSAYRITNRIIPKILAFFMAFGIELGVASEIVIGAENIGNGIKYHEKIKDYEERLKEYVTEVKEMNLDDFQTIMKVVDDMWKTIRGYGEPSIDANGYLRLDMMEDGVGVCRNMADDITHKLNAINPEYNARNLIVYLDSGLLKENGAQMSNIERKFVENENEQDSEEPTEENLLLSGITKICGNHMVTAVDIPGKNITLVIDSTNPQIGVFVDGKIHMFFNEMGEGIRTVLLGQVLSEGGNETIDVLQTQVLSFLPTEYTLEELEEMYGTEAQNKALEQVRAKSKSDKSDEWKTSYLVAIRDKGLQEGTQTSIEQELSYDTEINIPKTNEHDSGSTTTSTEEEEYEIR